MRIGLHDSVTERIPPPLSDDPSSDKGMARFSRDTLGPLVGRRRRALAGSGGRVVLSGGLVVVACRVVVACVVVVCRVFVAWRGGLSVGAGGPSVPRWISAASFLVGSCA